MTSERNSDFILLPSDATDAMVSALLMKISEDQGLIDQVKAQADKLLERGTAADRRIKAAKEAIQKWMDANGHKSKRFPEATVSVKAGRQSVKILDENKLPLDCFCIKEVRSPDKEQIKARLLTGTAVDGATLSNAAPTLQIRF